MLKNALITLLLAKNETKEKRKERKGVITHVVKQALGMFGSQAWWCGGDP